MREEYVGAKIFFGKMERGKKDGRFGALRRGGKRRLTTIGEEEVRTQRNQRNTEGKTGTGEEVERRGRRGRGERLVGFRGVGKW